MEHWNHKSLQQHRFQHRRERQNPSFSSSLLDQIYRSIDQLDHQHQPAALAMKHQQTPPSSKTRTTTSSTSSSSSSRSSSTTVFGDKELDLSNFQRACLIEKWMDQKKKKPAPKSERTKSGSARELSRNSRQNGDAMLLNSSSSSSDSSCGGLFSSDSTETNYVVAPTKSMMSSSSGSYTDHRPKPIRTSTQPADQKKSSKYDINIGGGFVKTKSKALKIYSDLKKARQPISPGGKLANFLNSIFNTSITSGAATASAKKPKIHVEDDLRKSKSAQASTCSSATSFSRSCLSKTPTSSSSGGKSNEKRSVRFSPVSVMIVNQQDKYVGNNITIREKSCISEEISIHIKEKSRRIEEAARDLLANYQKKVDQCHEIMEEEDEDDDDDNASCASSDLFELDNLSSIPGIERYCKELPVYETTYFDTSRPIPTGFII